jgi:hypothetical protein
MYKEYKSKKLLWSGFEPRTSIPSRCLNHYASSVIEIALIVTVYKYCRTWRLVTYFRRPTRGPAASRASHCRVTGIPGQRPRAVQPRQLTRQSHTSLALPWSDCRPARWPQHRQCCQRPSTTSLAASIVTQAGT